MATRLTFGERCALIRRRHRTKQIELAKLLGVCERTVQKIEELPNYERRLLQATKGKLDIILHRWEEELRESASKHRPGKSTAKEAVK